MLARFFIDRPVLAWVISVIIILLGGIAAWFLPVAEYPEITPPTVRVTANYPGANAQVVADTVAAPIEQQVVGVENMLYMASQSNNDGSYTPYSAPSRLYTIDFQGITASILVFHHNRVA